MKNEEGEKRWYSGKQLSGSQKTMFKHAAAAAAKSLQSCPTLCDPMDCSPPGSSIYGIFQARVLEWGAIAFSSSNMTDQDLAVKAYVFNK